MKTSILINCSQTHCKDLITWRSSKFCKVKIRFTRSRKGVGRAHLRVKVSTTSSNHSVTFSGRKPMAMACWQQAMSRRFSLDWRRNDKSNNGQRSCRRIIVNFNQPAQSQSSRLYIFVLLMLLFIVSMINFSYKYTWTQDYLRRCIQLAKLVAESVRWHNLPLRDAIWSMSSVAKSLFSLFHAQSSLVSCRL